jgi:hypothetical protein
MTSILGQYLINDPEIKIPNRLLGYTSGMEMLNFNVESKPGCILCNAPEPEPKEPEEPKTQDQCTQTEVLIQETGVST